MARLTDTQVIILSAASQRDDRGVELPANIKGAAARKVVDKLVRAGLLEEVRAGGSLPVWRRDDESGAMALRITKTGLEAIDVEDEPTAAPKETSVRPARAREVETPRPRPSPPASGVPLQHRSPLAKSIARVRRRPKLACDAKADRARNKPACLRCWNNKRARRLLPSCARPIGNSTRSAASSLVWYAKSSASTSTRRKSMVTVSTVSPAPMVHGRPPADRAVARLERHAARDDRSGSAE